MINRFRNIVRYQFQNLKGFLKYFQIVPNFAPKADLILLFHGVDTRGSQRYNLRFTSQSDFVFLIEILRKHYHLSRLEDLAFPSASPRAVITFDDGYKNWTTHLLPLLEKFRIPATLFITKSDRDILWTDQYDIFRCHYAYPLVIDDQTFRNVDGFYRTESGVELNKFLKRSGYKAIEQFQKVAAIQDPVLEETRPYWELLTNEDIRRLSESKWITIGSHGCTHTSLDTLDDESLRSELTQSKADLSEITGSPVRSISFPSGKFDERVIDFARAAGYEFLLAEELRFSTPNDIDPYLFERKGIYTTGNKYWQITNLISNL